MAERRKSGPFLSFEDFLRRIGPALSRGNGPWQQDVRILIRAGCFDRLEGRDSRAGLMWRALQFFSKEEAGSPSLFSKEKTRIAPIRPFSPQVMLRHEWESLGLPVSVHPLECYGGRIRTIAHVRAADFRDFKGRLITAIGWQITGKTVHTKEGEPMKFISFEDTTGIYETVLFPAVYRRFCHMLDASRPYLLRGTVEEDRGALTLNIRYLELLT